MANLKSGLVLGEGENLVIELEAEMWAESANLIAQLLGFIKKFFSFILGFKRKGFIVITDRRVVEVVIYKGLWVLNVGQNTRYLLPSSIKEVGYTKEGTCFGCFCQSYNLYYESFTQRTKVLLSAAMCDNDAQKVVDAFYKAIARA